MSGNILQYNISIGDVMCEHVNKDLSISKGVC